VASDGKGILVISNENVTTGTFGGALSGSGVSFPIIAGQVTGTSFTLTIEVAGTVVGEHGEQIDFGGTVNGDKITLTSTATRAWANGESVKGDNPGTYHGTRKGSMYMLMGEIILQCDSGGSSCLANGEPFEGLKVNVTGDNGTASDTTNEDGMWTVKLPSGSYTITPTDPNMTFTPLNAEVYLDADTTVKKFSACASAQTADSPQALSRRPESKARGLIYSLVGINCTTSEFSAVYNTKATPILKLTWKSSVYQCGSTRKFVHQESTDVPIPYSDVQRKDDANGVTVWLKIDSPKGNPRYDPILKMTVNPGYASGSVTLNGLGVGEDTFEGASINTCTPVSAQMTLATGTGL
jgi:hypothetical protein